MGFRWAAGHEATFKVVGGVTLLVVTAATVLPALRNEHQRQVRRFETWYIDGPQCRRVHDDLAAAPSRKIFTVDGVRIAREHGHMSCLSIRDHGGAGPGELVACHMVSPGRIEVTGRWGAARFDPGPGGPATILAGPSSVRCVTRINPAVFARERPYD